MAGEVTIVAPVYNNARALPELCRRLRAAFGARLGAIVLVDDASTDDSAAVIDTLDVTAVKRARNGGQSAAILTGLTLVRTPVVCVLDADLEDPPEAMPGLVARLDQDGAGVVFSSRDEPRPIGSRLFRAAMRTIFPTLPAHPCLCFAMDETTRRQVLDVASEGDYLVAVIGALEVTTAQLRVSRGPRPDGASSYSPRTRTRYAARMLGSALRLKRAIRRRQRSAPAGAPQTHDRR